MRRPAFSKRQVLWGAAFLFALAGVGAVVVNPHITTWIESSKFQELLDKETSKGLKLTANYAPLHRTGLLSMSTDSFTGTNGYKTIVSIHAHDISGTFNPLGIYLRRWQLDSVHIHSGTVMIQKTEATPGAPKGAPWPPWWALFWPYRVQLQDVKIDTADVLFNLQDKESGIYQTGLEITPNGHDFEYDARGGTFKTPLTPPLNVDHIHLLIRKPRLYCPTLVLNDNWDHPEERLTVTGDAGLQDDRTMHLKMILENLVVAPWLPEKSRAHVEGRMNGHFDYSSTGTGLETGHGVGTLEIVDGVLNDLPPIHQYITITGSLDPGPIHLKICRADIKWDAGAITAEKIEAEGEGVFRMTGTLTLAADKTLSGQVELGLTDAYLKWLPTARSSIFTRDEGPYHFTTIHFSGTSKKPEQDLTPRITHEISKSPLLAIKLFFNSASTWFESDMP